MAKIIFGVHNDEFNLDYYDDGSIMVYNHDIEEEVTTFDQELVALFMSYLDRGGEFKRLLDIEKERMRKWRLGI